MTILITGANGQLGQCLQDVANLFPMAKCVFVDRQTLAIDDNDAVIKMLQGIKPQWVINTAAYTAVDKAEQEPELAYRINVEAPGHLAAVCRQLDVRFIHISTDYVFDGQANLPYVENDATNPINIYGQTKLLGEKLVMAQNPAAVIVRTSWVYSRHGSNFVKTMLRLMVQKPQISVVDDQFGCPTYAIDLAKALLGICTSRQAPAGIYHYCNSGVISWYNFAQAIASYKNFNCTVLPIPTSGYPTPAARPQYSAMDCQKITETYGFDQQNWQDSLEECLQLM